jgi:hypothetical protein
MRLRMLRRRGMLAVKGFYDGSVVRLAKAAPVKGACEVIITFADSLPADMLDMPGIRQERAVAYKSLVGLLRGNTLSLEDAKAERRCRRNGFCGI